MKNRLVKSLSTVKKMFVAFVAAMILFSSNSLSAQRINMIDIIGDVDSVAAAFTKSGLRLVAKNNEVKYNNEKAMLPGGGKDELGF